LYFLSVSITVCFNNSPDLRSRLGCGHLRWSVAKVGAEAARAAAARCRERDSGAMREREASESNCYIPCLRLKRFCAPIFIIPRGLVL
jgi:hypothetical protein